jgi:tetratricopeptide (TPR) repeat protein
VSKLSTSGAFQLAATVCAVGLLEMVARAAPGSEGSAPVGSARVQDEMKQGAQALRAGKYDEAEEHYRNALKLDPSQKTALVFLARSIRAQYTPGIDDPQNVAKATEAISIYQRALQIDPNQDEAFTAVDELYAALKNEPKQRDWLLKRAESEGIPKGKRSAAYQQLANLDLACTRRMAAAEPAAADRCAASGLESIRRAIALNGDSEALLTQQAQLLHERAKLAEGLGSSTQHEAYEKQALAAEKRVAELREDARKKSESLPTY